ncbi:MAG: hypothetical protein AABY18_06565 [Candidatus Thermoplasmatota archaeon]
MRLPISWMSLALMAGLWVIAFLAAIPIIHSPVYWDESVHYFTARNGSPVDGHFQDLWGNRVNSPDALFWQRPAWYAMFWAPAQGDLATFRVAHAAVAAGLAPIGFALLRAFGFTRVTGAAAGLALAVMPPLPTWAALGFMDPMMAEALGLAVVARRLHWWRTSAAFAVLAVWFKETALILVAAWTAIELIRGWINGRAKAWPLRLGEREASAVYATLLAPLPILYGMLKDVPTPGGFAYHPTVEIADAVLGTSWLAVPLAVGLLLRPSRALAALGLATGAFFVVLQVMGRSTESWYLVPSVLFAVVGAAAACEAVVRAAWRRPALRAAALALVLASGGVCAAAAALPSDAGREHLFPLSGRGPLPWREEVTFQTTVRDQELEAAFAALPIDGHTTLVLIEPHWPPEYVRLADAGPVIMDMAYIRAFVGLDTQRLAQTMEANGTWTMLYEGKHPMQQAIAEVYADCVVERFGGISLIIAEPCAGRWQQLEAADRRFGGP